MLHNTPAVQALRAGCRRLQLPEGTAVELVHFLQVKRTHDQFLPASARPRNMSPGAAVDKLWHFMLLNTDISSMVHELVGGVVRHIGTDEDDLHDDVKKMQRLYAFNIMAREGDKPDIDLWVDPGTNMSAIHPVWQPDGTTLYLCPDLTAAEKAALTADLACVYSTMSSSNSRGRKRRAEAAADATDGNADPGMDDENHEEPLPYRKYIIVVNTFDGRACEVYLPDGASSLSVAQIKRALVAKLSTPAAQMHLAKKQGFSLVTLRDTAVITPPDNVLEPYTIVRVLLPSVAIPRVPSTPYTVFVKTFSGKTVRLVGELAPWFLVWELKQAIQHREGIPTDQQRIILMESNVEMPAP